MPEPVVMEARGRALRALADDVESVADSAANVLSQTSAVDAVAESPVNPLNWF